MNENITWKLGGKLFSSPALLEHTLKREGEIDFSPLSKYLHIVCFLVTEILTEK
jgi:hypothetical protein